MQSVSDDNVWKILLEKPRIVSILTYRD